MKPSARNKIVCVVLSLAIVWCGAGCTKRVAVPREDYKGLEGREEFIYVTTVDGKVYELQGVEFTDRGVSGLLRHEGSDVRPIGLGGVETRSAYIEIRYEDIQSLEVERVNKPRLIAAFALVGGGIILTIAMVKAAGKGGNGGGGGDLPDGKP